MRPLAAWTDQGMALTTYTRIEVLQSKGTHVQGFFTIVTRYLAEPVSSDAEGFFSNP